MSDEAGIKTDSVSKPFFILANSVLPLNLVYFSAKQTGRAVLLNWQTSTELNTKSFEVERCSDGVSWIKIATVSAKELNNNAYIYNDQSPLTNQNFYRIKMNDKDGVYTYTIIRKIDLGDKELLMLVPNPAIDKTTVYFGFNTRGGVLMVTDLAGSVVKRYAINDNTSFYTIPTGNLPSGNYMIRIESKIGVTTKKLTVAH